MPAAIPAAIIGAGAIGAIASSNSANKAANAQTQAAAQATNAQQEMFDKTQANLAPFIAAGQGAQNQLTAQLPSLTKPINMDQATLEQIPGYQFNLSQGLKAIQNSASSRGLGVSGAAQKGAAQFATGLADNTYQNQFNNAVTNQTNTYNRLLGATELGENAAAGLGNNAVQTGANIGNNITGAGQGQAGAYIQQGNAFGSAANSGVNALLANQYLQNQTNGLYGSPTTLLPSNFGTGASYTI